MFQFLESISLHNKYLNLYKKIVLNAKTRKNISSEYCESHHIIPRSIGGDDDLNNLVILLTREHFICHLLLVKFLLPGQNRHKMLFALNMMRSHDKHHRYFNSRLYLKHKTEFIIAQTVHIQEMYSDPEKRETIRNKRKKFWENNPEKRAEYNKRLSDKSKQQDRLNIDWSTVKLKGEARTDSQKEATKQLSEKLKGRIKSVEYINVFGVLYRTYKDAARAMKLGFDLIKYLKEHKTEFNSLEEYKIFLSNKRQGA